VKVTFNVTVCPPGIMSGITGPLTEKAPPWACKAEIFTSQERVFVTATAVVTLAPVPTAPNDILAGLAVSAALDTPSP